MSYLKGVVLRIVSLATQPHRFMQLLPPLQCVHHVTAFITIIALCMLIVVSGPHLVHHFPEQYGSPSRLDTVKTEHQNHTHTDAPHHEHAAHHHTHAGHASDDSESSHDRHPTSWLDCFVLFLMQYTPITWGAVAFLLIPLLITALTVGMFCPPSAMRRQLTLARAPPFPSVVA